MLISGLRGGATSAAGWLAASELLLEEGAADPALDAAKQVGPGAASAVLFSPLLPPSP